MDRGPRPGAARRARLSLPAAIAAAALIGGGFLLARGAHSAGTASGSATASPGASTAGCGAAPTAPCAANPAGAAVAAPPAVVTVPSRQPAGRAQQPTTMPTAAAAARTPSAPALAPGTGTAAGQPAASVPGSPPSTPASLPAAPDSPPPASPSPVQDNGPAVAQVLALINQARATGGLPALTIIPGLSASSAAHNARMADGCGLSHQCPGEPALGARETAAGVDWTAAGENIGDGGPVAGTAAAIASMAVGLTQSMLNEQPPDDGHRMNILSAAFTHIGIAVDRDSAGTVWLTQDFAN